MKVSERCVSSLCAGAMCCHMRAIGVGLRPHTGVIYVCICGWYHLKTLHSIFYRISAKDSQAYVVAVRVLQVHSHERKFKRN